MNGHVYEARKTRMIFSSDDVFEPDSRKIGNKAANLWRLSKAGLNVPRWFAITWDMLMTSACVSDNDSRPLGSGDSLMPLEINEKHFSKTLNGRFQALVEEELNAKFADVRFFAVRSSATDEDSTDASYAGILESYLFVRREDVLGCIMKVAASALSEKAAAYRKARGLSAGTTGVAVIVQEMISSEKSGVLFTSDPITATNAWLVTAGFGVGEGVVADRVESDTFWLDHEKGTVLSTHITTKRSKMTRPEHAESGARIVPIPESADPVLSTPEIEQIFQVKKTIEHMYREPQDVEWAIDASGEVHVLQTRPITACAASLEEITVWDNSDIVESYPGVTTPLTYSFARHVYEQVMKRALMGLNRKLAEKNSPLFESLIGYHDGRIYYNLTNWYRMVSFNPALARDKSACNRMLGIRQNEDVNVTRTSSSYFSYAVILWKYCFRHHYQKKFYRDFADIYGRHAGTDFNACTPAELWETFKKIEVDLLRIWPITIENDLFVMLWYEFLARFLKKAGVKSQAEALQNAIINSTGEMESVKPLRSLVKIARMISGNRRMASLFNLEDDTVLKIIKESPEFSDIRLAMLEHLEKYGDRTFQELKLESPSLRDDPAALIRLLRTILVQESNDPTSLDRRIDRTAERHDVLRTVADKTFISRMILRFLVNRAREGTVHRENMRFARSRIYGLIKNIFCAIGSAYVRQGLLDNREDIFFLSMEEIFGIIKFSAVNHDLRETVRMRREHFLRQQEKPTPPSRIYTRGLLTYSHRPDAVGDTQPAGNGSPMKGIGCCAGQATGRARIIRNAKPGLKVDGEILVAEMTDPGWVFLMIGAKGIIVERGSILSHTAIIGRELGIPTITGLANATSTIIDGEILSIDGATGIVTRVGEGGNLGCASN